MRDIEKNFGSSSRGGNSSSHKFLIIGDTECGKTTILDYYCAQKVRKKTKKTIGCEIHIKDFIKKVGGVLNTHQYVEFWDLSGDAKFQPYIDVYTQAIENNISAFKGIIFFFDATNRKTLLRLSQHLEILSIKKAQIEDEEPLKSENNCRNISLPLLIVGNKIDLADGNKSKKMQEARQYLEQTFTKDIRLKCIFLSNKMDLSEYREVDKFVEDSIAGNFDNLYLYNPTKDSKYYTHQRFSTFKEEMSRIFNQLTFSIKWMQRVVKTWMRKRNRKHELPV